MARRSVSIPTITPTAVADTTNMTDQTYPWVLQGGSSTQLIYIHEISISGQAASSSSPTFMILSRDSTVAATAGSNATGFTDAPLDSATAALTAAPLTGDAWTTKPQRSSTLHLLNASVNAFGGVYFWRANKIDEAIRQVGNTATAGETSLSAFTGGTPGAVGCHMVYEPL